MSKYSYFNLIKRNAKQLAREQAQKLSAAQEQLAVQCDFVDFHELTTVAKRNAADARLMSAALGVSDLGELIDEESVQQALELEVEDALSDLIAETNACAFAIENIEVIEGGYDGSTGIVLLKVTFSYAGEQDAEKVYHGSTFYVDANVRLLRASSGWNLLTENGLEIIGCESDVERDYRIEQQAVQLE